MIFLIVIVIFLITIGTYIQLSQKSDGEKLDFTFELLDGTQKELNDYYGKVIVLDLMGVNCQPCMYQMYELKKISENYSRDQVIIISIDVWIIQGETPDMVNDYIDAFNEYANIDLDWTFGVDDTQGSIGYNYATQGVPTLYILNKKGNIYYTHVGYEAYDSLVEKIDQLLG